jgi:hypothetical protein
LPFQNLDATTKNLLDSEAIEFFNLSSDEVILPIGVPMGDVKEKGGSSSQYLDFY